MADAAAQPGAPAVVKDKNEAGDRPAQRIAEKNGGQRGTQRNDGQKPDDAQQAGSACGDQHRRKGIAAAADRSGEDFDTHIGQVVGDHPPYKLHTNPQHRSVIGEDAEQGLCEGTVEDAHRHRGARREKQSDAHAFTDTVVTPGSEILPGEGGDGDAEIAIAMQDAVMQAYTGTGAYEGTEAASGLRSLMRLWPNYVQLVTTADTGIKSVNDLIGKRVGVGAANSGVELNARMILSAYGITYDMITPDYLAYGEAIDNMKNGQCDAVFVTSGLPNATVMDLGVSYDMVVVPIDGEGRDKLVEEYPYYAKTVIPANTYNNTEDIEGVFVYNIMMVREDLSDAMVYDMLTGIFENIKTIQASHNAADKNIYLEVGVDDLQLPLHPGAEAFWKDQGYIK